MFVCILDSKILRSLENLLKMQSYDRAGDPDEHVEHVENMIDYYHVEGAVKCKLFGLTFRSLDDMVHNPLTGEHILVESPLRPTHLPVYHLKIVTHHHGLTH